jgi:hypothetical protein
LTIWLFENLVDGARLGDIRMRPAVTSNVLKGHRLAVVVVLMVCASACAPYRPSRPVTETVVQPAVDGVFEIFKTQPLLGLSIDHGSAPGGDLYNALIRDPRFARDVRNVVVEFGGAAHQDIIDRYLAGEPLPYTELRKVWTDMVGINITASNTSYVDFFAEIRAVNRSLPPDQRIRVWLGEPPIDWSQITTNDQYMKIAETRDSYPADLIVQNVLAKNEKALVIYGGAHFDRGLLGGLVEAKHPGAFFFVKDDRGSVRDPVCSALREKAKAIWPAAALAAPAQGGMPGEDLRECASKTYSNGPFGGPFVFDAVVFLGPDEILKDGPRLPDIYLDADYQREIDRQYRIYAGTPLPYSADGLPLRRADYRDLDAPGWSEAMDAMFGRFDADKDGLVSEQEYRRIVPQ